MLHVQHAPLVGTGPSYIALRGTLIPTASALPVHPPQTGQPLAMDAAAAAGGGAVPPEVMTAGAAADSLAADVTKAGAVGDALAAGIIKLGEPADTASAADAEVTTAEAGADPVAATIVSTGVAADPADVLPDDMTTAEVAGNTTHAVLAEGTTTAAVADTADAVIADDTMGEVASAGGVPGKVNLMTQVADQTAGDGHAVTDAVAARPQVHKTVSHVSDCKHASMADGRHTGSLPAAFLEAAAFSGGKTGMLFKAGDQGLGYYADILAHRPGTAVVQPLQRAASSEAKPSCGRTSMDARELEWHCNHADVRPQPEALLATMSTDSTPACTDNVASVVSNQVPVIKAGLPSGKAIQTEQREGKAEERKGKDAAEADVQVKGAGTGGEAERGTKVGHYWGQALQYLDRSVQVCHPLARQCFLCTYHLGRMLCSYKAALYAAPSPCEECGKHTLTVCNQIKPGTLARNPSVRFMGSRSMNPMSLSSHHVLTA